MDETTLTNAARRGALSAFNELILLYQDFLFRVAVRMLADEDSAPDMVLSNSTMTFRLRMMFDNEQ